MCQKLLPLVLGCTLLLAGCTAPPEPTPTPSPTPSVCVEVPRPVPAVQIALIRDYMGPDCRGTDGDLFSGGWDGDVRIQKLDLACDGETVTGTVEGVIGDRGYARYFRAAVRGVVGMNDGEPYVETLTYKNDKVEAVCYLRRSEEAITDENRKVVARRWYDRPVLPNNDASNAKSKVNVYFETECQTFMADADGHFWGGVEELLKHTGPSRFIDQNLLETITTGLTYLDESLLSVKKTRNWFMAGTSPVHYSGDTFDLNTGERLDLDYFIKADIADFNDWVTNQVCAIGWKREEVEDFYSGLTFADYQYAYDGGSVSIFLEEPFVAGGAPVLRYEL